MIIFLDPLQNILLPICFKAFHFADDVVNPLKKGIRQKAIVQIITLLGMCITMVVWYDRIGKDNDEYYLKNGELQGVNNDSTVLQCVFAGVQVIYGLIMWLMTSMAHLAKSKVPTNGYKGPYKGRPRVNQFA